MHLTFTQADAQILSVFLASVVVPFLTSWLKSDSWSKWARFGLAVLLSAVAGGLTVYANGDLADGTSVIQAALAVFALAQANYASWFKGLGLEDQINPPGPTIEVELED